MNKTNYAESDFDQPLRTAKSKIQALSDQDLFQYLIALERATDVWIQTFMGMAGKDVYERSRKAIASTVGSKQKHISATYMLENFSLEDYNIDLLPFMCTLGDIQMFEAELEARGLLESFYAQAKFERYNPETGKAERITYPIYEIRAADLILGYLSEAIGPEYSGKSVKMMGNYLEFVANNIKKTGHRWKEDAESDDVDEDCEGCVDEFRGADGRFMA